MEKQDSSLEQLFLEDPNLTEKQKSIILAAIDSFSEKGYAATSTSEIAKKAGVAEGTIFRHYKTKKDLLLSITAPMMTKMIAPFLIKDLNRVLEQKYESLEAFLLAMVQNRIEFIQNNLPLVKILLQEIPFHDDLRKQFIENIGKKVVTRFSELAEYYQSKGDITTEFPAAAIVRMIASSLIGFVAANQILSDHEQWDSEKELERTIAFIMKGLKKETD